MNKVDLVERSRLRTDVPAFRPGDTVKVHVRVTEGTRERIQVFQGVVISRRGGGLRESFTVRKVSFGVGVERTFPVHAPMVSKLEIVSHGKVRRAKLYYLRELTGRKAKIRERRVSVPEEGTAAVVTAETVEVAEPEEPEAATEAPAEASADTPAEAEKTEEPTETPAET